eukprot:COSAG02_NODE_24743_length_679_cov_0.629310_1_plen_57_part_10
MPEGTVALPAKVRPGTKGGLALLSQRPLVTAAPVSLADYLTYPLVLNRKSFEVIESQ